MAKARDHKCMMFGCLAEGVYQLGLRLRKYPGPDNVWTHDTGAYLCETHAHSLAIDVDVTEHQHPNTLWTDVHHADVGEHVVREKAINVPPAAPAVE